MEKNGSFKMDVDQKNLSNRAQSTPCIKIDTRGTSSILFSIEEGITEVTQYKWRKDVTQRSSHDRN